jgi:hypothetical protein
MFARFASAVTLKQIKRAERNLPKIPMEPSLFGRDYQALVDAVDSGRVKGETGP